MWSLERDSVSIKEELKHELQDAMRTHDRNRADVVRQIVTDVARALKAPGFTGEEDDALYRTVIGSYAKKMSKALPEYERVGRGDSEAADKLRYEVDYLGRWLPKTRSEDELAALVDAAIQATGAADMKAMGQVMGYLRKAHSDIDGATASRLVKARLG